MAAEANGASRTTDNVPLLEMRGISKSFPGVQALEDVNLTVDAGEVLALVGENGAGKSTLIKILAGANSADSGEILIDGERAEISTPVDSERYAIATVYQELNLFPSLSVAENLLFGSYPKKGRIIDWQKVRQEAGQFLASFGVHIAVDDPVSSLSVAEKQMLEIAKALHRNVRIIILDEPTAVLGGEDVEELMRIVRSLRSRGVAVIFISHRLSEIFGLADRYLVLKDGVQVGQGSIGDTSHDDLVAKMVGRQLEALPGGSSSRRTREELLRAEDISRDGILHNISLSLHAGEILGIAGLRGAGRTELARAIFGADQIDEGKIFVRGSHVKIDSPTAAVEHGIGLLPEDRKTQGLLTNLSISENITIVKMVSSHSQLIRPHSEDQLASKYVDSLDIRTPSTSTPVGNLSGGNQQKVAIGKWLEAGVSVLILDEPTRGVDIGSKREIYEVVHQLCDEGIGIILISSELPEVLEMSDRILVMYQGRIAAEIDRHDASEEVIMNYAVGGGHSDEQSA